MLRLLIREMISLIWTPEEFKPNYDLNWPSLCLFSWSSERSLLAESWCPCFRPVGTTYRCSPSKEISDAGFLNVRRGVLSDVGSALLPTKPSYFLKVSERCVTLVPPMPYLAEWCKNTEFVHAKRKACPATFVLLRLFNFCGQVSFDQEMSLKAFFKV